MLTAEETAGAARVAQALRAEMGKVLVGREALIERLLVGLLCRGHVLLEGVPGLAKTLAVTTLSRVVTAACSRVQFTPDLLPADIRGAEVYQPATGAFAVRKGPIFANIVLADEINRAPAKVQSALLDAMAEGKVTIGGETFDLPRPFLVLATQNPIEQEGTYPLPEAMADRFLLHLTLGYPGAGEEAEIVRRACLEDEPEPRAVLDGAGVLALSRLCGRVRLDARLTEYIVAVVAATRDPAGAGLPEFADKVAYGASPRASIALARTARALALLSGRDFAGPADVKAMAADVLRHRILLTYEGLAEGLTPDAVIAAVLGAVPVP